MEIYMTTMDVTQNLKNAENSLRDLIYQILNEKYQKEWELKCWITSDKIEDWKERRNIERKKIGKTVAIDERLLYYANFEDLETILTKNWGLFSDIFWEQKQFLPYLKILWDYRNTDAHRRELFPHQKNLILGISGEIRTKIVRYRSKNENSNDYFPRLECIQESLWRTWLPDNLSSEDQEIKVRVGDEVQFIISATDPKGGGITYWLYFNSQEIISELINNITYIFTESDIGKDYIQVYIKSDRIYHKHWRFDDAAYFTYLVLPKE